MAENYITRDQFQEYEKRMIAEDERQNKRLEVIEKRDEQLNRLALSVNELAASVKSSAKEMERLSRMMETNVQTLDGRLTRLESKDGERWRSFVGYLISGIVGILIGFIFKQIGII